MFEKIERVTNKIRRELAHLGVAPVFQKFEFLEGKKVSNQLTILIVAPGSVPIPPTGWGAVETIIAETIPEFRMAGMNIGLLNSQNFFEWKKAKSKKYDVIICHSDSHLGKVKKHWPNTPVVAISHYGFAAQPNLWHSSYEKVFSTIMQADKIVCLSPEIYKTFSKAIEPKKLLQLGNASNFAAKVTKTKSNCLVVIGKVEKRKRQFELWNYANLNGLEIDFIGPVSDERITEQIHLNHQLARAFLGERKRLELTEILPRYRALLLMSEGEADALVLYEAQLAGLEIIANRTSIGSQELNLPWVHLIEDFDDLKRTVLGIIKDPINPQEISDYAQKNYRWNTKLVPMIRLIRELGFNEK